MNEKISVLIVDDAFVVRILVGKAIARDPDLDLIGKAENGRIALEKIAELRPDVILLDIEMPELNGLEVLRQLKAQGMPTRVIMFSTYTTQGAQQTIEALELGAADFVAKPSSAGFSQEFEQVQEELLTKIKFVGSRKATQPIRKPTQAPSSGMTRPSTAYELVVMEGGMGSPTTFLRLLPQLPKHFPAGLLMFQAMLPGFADQFVRRLHQHAQIPIKVAVQHDRLTPGQGLVLVGEQYVATRRSGADLQLAFREKDPTERYGAVPRILCESIAKVCGPRAIGVLLAGAGEGNLEGIQAMKDQGGVILAEEPTNMRGQDILQPFVEHALLDEIVPTQDIIPTLLKTLGLSK